MSSRTGPVDGCPDGFCVVRDPQGAGGGLSAQRQCEGALHVGGPEAH